MSSESEREALAKVIDDAADVPVSPERVRTSLSLWLADAILAAGFRRTEPSSEVPEPSAEQVLAALVESSRLDHEQHNIKRPFSPGQSLSDYDVLWVDRMRAALRAAAEVGR